MRGGKTETVERDISLPPSPNDATHGITEDTYREEKGRQSLFPSIRQQFATFGGLWVLSGFDGLWMPAAFIGH